MEQMYLIEILIDKVTIYASDEENSADKNLIIKIKFGPKVEFIIKEGQMAKNEQMKDDIIESDENGRRKWSRTIRVGKSYLFPSYPDTILMILSKFPLEIEVYNDDDKEVDIFVGVGTMNWHTEFFHMLKETTDVCKPHEPLSIKQKTVLYGECYCKQVGEIDFILRLSALGESIITEFQQLMKDPDSFVFRTNKAPSMFQCKRIENDNPNFCMVGSLYETTTLEDPTITANANQKLEICTDLQSCATGQNDDTCMPKVESENRKKYPIDKIRMGDITGPCGNTNCPLAHKVKTYIRSLPFYKNEIKERLITETKKEKPERKVCGSCICKDDRYHREGCPERDSGGKEVKVTCSGCQGITSKGETCTDKKILFGTNVTPKASTHVSYVTKMTKDNNLKECRYGKQYTLRSLNYITGVKICPDDSAICSSSSSCQSMHDKRSIKLSQARSAPDNNINNQNQPNIYNFEVSESKRKLAILNCTEMANNKDCKCSPPKPAPPCKTMDCHCITEAVNIAARKSHKQYCPSFKHKENCPVTLITEENETKIEKDDENETEPLPYGLPPIKLGPCPVLGRPCAVPDGFARMYKTAALPPLPPSYSDAGKVCCSKEFARIKEAIKEYMKNEKGNDYRCVSKFYADTERRCCDKEQRLLSLMGKGCCGSHKMAIHEKYKDQKKS